MNAPPGYAQSLDESPASTSVSVAAIQQPEIIQIHISPSPDAIQFQNGYLGVDGETAAFEERFRSRAFLQSSVDTV